MKQKLLKNLKLRAVMLVAILCAGFTSAWGETKTLTFVQTSASAGTLSGDVPTGVTATFRNTYTNNKEQLTSGNSMTLTLSGWNTNTTIKGVTLEVKNNASKGNGTATVKIGDNTLGTLSITGLGSTYQEKAMTITETKTTSDLVITISATVNSVYCDKFIISYEEGGSQTETCATPTFNPAAGIYTSAQNVEISTATNGATIYYTTDGTTPSSSNGTEYSSAITVSETQTIKAIAVKDGLDNSSVASATYTIIQHAGTSVDPYTVADAKAAIDANTGVTGVYVTGIVCEGGSSLSSGAMNYWISDDGTKTNKFEIYKGKGISGADFSATSDIQVGDIVVVTGNLAKYNSTYEFSSGSQLVSLVHKPTVTVSESAINATAEETDGTITVTYEHITDIIADVFICDANGNTATYDWFDAEINNENNVAYTIGANTGDARTGYLKVYALDDNANEVYSELITITQAGYVAPAADEKYNLFTGELVEGDYIICYDGKAMNTTVTNERLQYAEVTPENDVITTDNAEIVWHIAKSGNYWTIYNAEADAYAASTGAKNKAQMLADGTDDKALWTVSGTETYEFVNKQNTTNNVNANLRNNGTYGFACYATSTGGALTLYKKVAPATESVTVTAAGYATYCSENALDFTNAGIKAYVGTLSGTALTFTPVTTVPANTGLLLVKDGGATEDIPVAASAQAVQNNCLVGTLVEKTLDANDYILNVVDGKAGFYLANTYTTLAAHRAYIPAQTGVQVKSFAINLDEADAISAVKAVNGNADIFNLAGQRVSKAQKGIYIVNGKKMLVK